MLSLKSKGQTFTRPRNGFLNPLFLIMQKSGKMIYLRYFINSIIITIFAIILSITIALFAAFALKRYNIRFKGALCNGYYCLYVT